MRFVLFLTLLIFLPSFAAAACNSTPVRCPAGQQLFYEPSSAACPNGNFACKAAAPVTPQSVVQPAAPKPVAPKPVAPTPAAAPTRAAPVVTQAPANPSSCPSLSLGSTGARVLALQEVLRKAYTDFPEPTGYFGPVTEAAVQRWQKDNGIISSGTPASTGWGAIGPRTAQAMGLCATSVATGRANAVATTTARRTTIAPGMPAPPPFGDALRTATSATTSVSNATSSGVAATPVSTSTTPCTFGAVSVESGNSVTAYRFARVPIGLSCPSQKRTCTGGVLSGTYQFATCSADSPDAPPTFRTTGPVISSWRARGTTFATSSTTGLWELVENSGTGMHQLTYATSTRSAMTSSDVWRFTVYARPKSDYSRLALRLAMRNDGNAANSSNVVRCSLTGSGAVVGSTRGSESSAFAVLADYTGNWYRCRVEASFDTLDSTQLSFAIQIENSAGTIVYQGDGLSGVVIDYISIEHKRSYAAAETRSVFRTQIASAMGALESFITYIREIFSR